MNILKIKPRFRIYTSFKDYLLVIKEILLNRVNTGDNCNDFEQKISQFSGSKYSICMPQGRVGIYYALKSVLEPGQKVILSPYTIADVINMVICAGGIPVFADIIPETCNIDHKKIETLIDSETSAIMVTHLHGLACQVDEISDICRKHNLYLIEDAAQAFGTRLNGKRVGTFGHAGIYSFGMYKNLTSFYGGMIITDQENLYKKIKDEISDLPYSNLLWINKKISKGLLTNVSTSSPLFQFIVYWIFRFGKLNNIRLINRFIETELDLTGKDKIPTSYLKRMTPMQAKIAIAKLSEVDNNNNIRIQYARMYYEGLKDIEELLLPPLKTDGSHIYTYFPIQFYKRDELVLWMIKNKCDIGVQHLKNTADLPAFEQYWRDCPNARKTADEVILLPTYPAYGHENIKHNIKVIRSFFRKDNIKSS